jgi:hypothetical protein
MFRRSVAKQQFEELVKSRLHALRDKTYDQLQNLIDAPVESVSVAGRTGAIWTIVELRSSGALRVVVQGMLEWRYLGACDVKLDGFYKQPDGSLTEMPEEEFWEFG